MAGMNFNDTMSQFSDGNEDLTLSGDVNRFASAMFSLAFQESKSESDGFTTPTDDEDSKAEKDNLKKSLIDTFRKYTKARRKFLNLYPDWKSMREENIKLLKDVVVLMKSEKISCWYSKLIGNGASIVGSTVLVTALLIVSPAAPVLLPLAIGGGAVFAAGLLTTVGAQITDLTLLKKRILKVNNVLKEDRQYFRLLESWLERMEKLVKEVETIVGVDEMKNLTADITEFCDKVKDCSDFASREYNDEFRNVVRKCTNHMRDRGSVRREFGILLQPIIMTIVFLLILMPRRNKIAVESSSEIAKMSWKAAPFLRTREVLKRLRGKLTWKKISAVDDADAADSENELLSSIENALNISNNSTNSVDISQGTLREQAIQVEKVTQYLQNELYYLEKMYNDLETLGLRSSKRV